MYNEWDENTGPTGFFCFSDAAGSLDKGCQTDDLPSSVAQKLRAQLASARQQLRRCQMKLVKVTLAAKKQERFEQNFKKLPDRQKLVLDQCLMKANTKSAKAAR